MNRPQDLEALSIHNVLSRYYWRENSWRRRRDSTSVIVHTYLRFSPNPEASTYEDYCRIKVLLHHPFRRADDLLEDAGDGPIGEQSWRQIFEGCCTSNEHPRDTLRSWDRENRPAEEDEDEDEEINPDFAELDEADWQVYAHLFPDAALPIFDLEDLERRPIDDGWDLDASRDHWEHVDRMASYIANQRREQTGHADEGEEIL